MEIGHLRPDAQRILSLMRERGSITPREILEIVGTTEGRKRLSEIRQAGVPLGYIWETGVREDGSPTRYKRHFIKEETDGTNP